MKGTRWYIIPLMPPLFPGVPQATPLARPRPLLGEAIAIGDVATFIEREDGGVVFFGGAPVFSWLAGDDLSRRLAAVQLARAGVGTRVEVAAAFGVSNVSLWRWDSVLAREGALGLESDKSGPKGAWKVTPEIVARVRVLRSVGESIARIAQATGISTFSVWRIVSAGVERACVDAAAVAGAADERVDPGGEGCPPEASFDVHAADAVIGSEALAAADADADLPATPLPTPRQAERQAARYGEIIEAAPVFTSGRELPLTGLLLTLPSLAATGFLSIAENVIGQLRNGFYGLRSTLLTLLFLAFIREPRAEGLARVIPHDLGRVLGLDRAPEVGTLRRKLSELSALGIATDLQQAIARHHAREHPDAIGFLYVDGHVRVYHGQRELPKHHVARMRISMSATLETWLNDAHGDPVFVVSARANAQLVSEIERLLPELQSLAPEGQRLTIVFDRGGWSPALFATLLSRGFDLLTYRKGKSEPEPPEAFNEHTYTDERGVMYTWELAERELSIALPQKAATAYAHSSLTLRQVTRRAGAHQTSILTSRGLRHDDPISTPEIAARMFNRWRQENYFRYAREHYALDALDEYAATPDDGERSVPNPERKKLHARLSSTKRELKDAEAELGAITHDTPSRTPGGLKHLKQRQHALTTRISTLRQRTRDLEHERASVPERVPLASLKPDAKQLATQRKLITHAVRMNAYNAESALARLLAPHYARAKDEARDVIREAITSSGSVRVTKTHLHVTLNPLSSPRRTRAIAALCNELNATKTTYPGTNLTLHYTIKTRANVTRTN